MTKQELEQALKNTLVNVALPHFDYGNWGKQEQILKVVKTFFDEKDPIIKDLSIVKWDCGQLFILRYKGYFVCEIKYTRRKGDTHYRTFEDYTDYYYKDFEITKDFDFTRRVWEIEVLINNQKIKSFDTEKEMYGYFKQLKAICGDKTSEVIDYLYHNKYRLNELYKNDCE